MAIIDRVRPSRLTTLLSFRRAKSELKPSTYDKRAFANAVALLDDYFGDPAPWRGRVSVGRLDMFSASDCVLGQLFEDYGRGCTVLESYDSDRFKTAERAFDGGFPGKLWREELAR